MFQITPEYPPSVSGVGDYASLLSGSSCMGGKPFKTLVANAKVEAFAPGEFVSTLGHRYADALVEGLQNAGHVLLHFSGYGYAKRGLCQWLVHGLTQWKSGGQDRRLVTMFHEVAATGPIWRSSFWTAAAQRRIARDLVRLSDTAFVSSQGGREQLARLAPEKNVRVLPVFSNVGEPAAPLPLAERTGGAVVFGGRGRREKVYRRLGDVDTEVAKRLNELGIAEIVDIGPPLDHLPDIPGCAVRAVGARPASAVSTMLANAKIGFVHYPGHVFTKSGIAAGYFAHRIPVVNTASSAGLPSDLAEGREFVGLDSFLAGDTDLQTVADAGFDWYKPHGVAATAEVFRDCLG